MQMIIKSAMVAAAEAVRNEWPDATPRLGILLGSGWGDAVDGFSARGELSYEKIPNLGKTGVVGHAGKLLLAECGGSELLIFQGRRHWYEGEGWTPVVLPIWICKQLGVQTVLLTNASGGIRDDLVPGSLMAICDHINMLGGNPLIGPHDSDFGTRFPDQTELYGSKLRKCLLSAGADSEGVYLATSGPTFETPAEIRAFQAMGADVVGMSTVPEAMFANALGIEVAGLSCVCNHAAGMGQEELTHEDVARAAKVAMPKMKALLETFAEEVCR